MLTLFCKMKSSFILGVLFSLIGILDICSSESSLPWYENLPAVAMDYKVHIDPGKEDCYFQHVHPGATFYVSFQVCRFNWSFFFFQSF